jgi:hypothetical protein
MLAPNELSLLLRHESVDPTLQEQYTAFCEEYPDFAKAKAEDFFTLALLGPSIAMALANGYISFFEELSLERKARSLCDSATIPILSRGMKHLIKNFEHWEERLYELIAIVLHGYTTQHPRVTALWSRSESLIGELEMDFMAAPYALVKMLSFLFLEDEEYMLNRRTISTLEYEKIKAVGEKVGLMPFPIFRAFMESYDVREQV